MRNSKIIILVTLSFLIAANVWGYDQRGLRQKDVELFHDPFDPFSEFKTDYEKTAIDLQELIEGGPGKDGIPSLVEPEFESFKDAERWLGKEHPVISLYINGQAKCYPLGIMLWHEVVNDTVGGVDVAVTFCPLSYSCHVYERVVLNKPLTFGVTGFLSKYNTVMYDYQSHSFWQQMTGDAIVGNFTGKKLKLIASQIISFEYFRMAYPDGQVLSEETGHYRDYNSNPYYKYDKTRSDPYETYQLKGASYANEKYYNLYGKEVKSKYEYNVEIDSKFSPMERFIVVDLNNSYYAYPYSISSEKKVINEELEDVPVVIFHLDSGVSALDERNIEFSKEIGSTGVFDRRVGEHILTFSYTWNMIVDQPTNSIWDITGHATQGMLKGERLKPIIHGDYFLFSWLNFYPETKIFYEQNY